MRISIWSRSAIEARAAGPRPPRYNRHMPGNGCFTKRFLQLFTETSANGPVSIEPSSRLLMEGARPAVHGERNHNILKNGRKQSFAASWDRGNAVDTVHEIRSWRMRCAVTDQVKRHRCIDPPGPDLRITGSARKLCARPSPGSDHQGLASCLLAAPVRETVVIR